MYTIVYTYRYQFLNTWTCTFRFPVRKVNNPNIIDVVKSPNCDLIQDIWKAVMMHSHPPFFYIPKMNKVCILVLLGWVLYNIVSFFYLQVLSSSWSSFI